MPTQEEIMEQTQIPGPENGVAAIESLLQEGETQVDDAKQPTGVAAIESLLAEPEAVQQPQVTPTAQPVVQEPTPQDEGGFFQDTGFGRGIVSGTKEFLGSAGLALEESSLKVNDAFRWLNASVVKSDAFNQWIDEQDQRIQENISDVQEYKADVPEMQGGVGEFFGQLIPQTALFATAILTRNPVLADAAVGTMGLSSVGSGLDTYEQYKKEKGEEVDELEKWGAGLAYGLAEFIPERIGLGVLMPKGVATKAAGKLMGQNIDQIAKTGKEMIEDLIKANPAKTTKLLKTLAQASSVEAGQEAATELMNMATDRYLTGMDISAKEFGQRLAMSAAGGAAMGGMLGPFSHFSQRAVDKARREAIGSVTVAQDDAGQTWELVDTKDGLVGFSPSGKVNKDLDPSIKDKAVTIPLEAFNRMVEGARDAGGFSDELFREEQHRSLRQHVAQQLNTYGHTDGKLHLFTDTKDIDESTGLPREYFVISEDAGMAIMMDREGNRRIESAKDIAPKTEALTEQEVFEQVRQRFDEQNPLEPVTADSEPDTFSMNGKEYKVTDVTPEGLWVAAEIDQNGSTVGEVIQLTPEQQQAVTDELLKAPEAKPDFRVIEASGQQYKLVPTADGNNVVDGITSKEEAEAAAQNIQNTLGEKLNIEVVRQDSGDSYTPDTYTVKLSEKKAAEEEAPQQPVYKVAGQEVTREDAMAYAAAAESSADIADLEVEGDEELTTFIDAQFQPEYRFKGAPVSKMMAQAMINSGRIDQLEIKNDPELEAQLKGPEEVVEEKPEVAQDYAAEEVTRVSSLGKEAEDGATMNLDGTKYEEGGLAVPVASMNTTQGELSREMINEFIEANQDKIPENSTVKAGLYKFPNSDQVSIDLNIVVPEANRVVALEFGKLAGQESMFDLTTGENVKTGADGKNPIEFNAAELKEIASSLAAGKLPVAVETTTKKQEPVNTKNEAALTQDFFSDVVTGKSDKYKPSKPWTPLLPFSEEESGFRKVFDKFKGNFDEHIATSIPGFRDVQVKVGNAISKMFGDKGGLVYDLGGSEGGFVKAITEDTGGRVKSINLDPNPDMQKVHEATPVEGSEFVPEAFHEGFDEFKAHKPTQKADVVHESMMFQFITNERAAYVKEVAEEYLKPEGLFITEEKFKLTDAEQQKLNEQKKNKDYKTRFYTEQQINEKAEEVLVGMHENQANYDSYKADLAKHFEYVAEYWDGGNFKGLVASNSKEKIDEFLTSVGETTTEFSETQIKKQQGPQKEEAPAAESRGAQDLGQAEKEVNTEPTEAQKEAGNYKKGHTRVQGFDITIENPKGSTRSGTDQKGKKWSTKMNNTYGYFKRTKGKDGDQIDVFLGPNPENGKIFVVDQIDPATGKFDEHKVMMGFDSRAEAMKAYKSNYSSNWQGMGPVVEVGKDAFTKWLNVEQTGKRGKRVPISFLGINRVKYPTNPANTTRLQFATQAQAAIKRVLSSVAPDTEVLLAETKEEFAKAIEGIKGANQNDKGILLTRKGKHTILINVSRMSTTTSAHELSHVVFAELLQASPLHFNQFKEDVSKALEGRVRQELEDFVAGYDKVDQGEEFFAELTAMMVDTKVPRSAVQALKEVINKWTNRVFGFEMFDKAVKAKDILDFFQNIADQIREGSVITEATIDLRKLGNVSEETVADGVKKQIFGERAELTPDVRSNLKVAGEMEAAGKDAKAIRLATGWERGKDGKWRYEVEDVKLTVTKGGNYKLKDAIAGPALEAYPKLRNYHLEIFPRRINANVAGGFNRRSKRIRLYSNTMDQANSTLAHEIQHAIQHLEGFDSGAHSTKTGEVDYWRSAGEVEARNVQERIEFTPEQRRDTTLEETEDVDRGQQLSGKKSRVMFQAVWHGSPHEFDKFRTENIGTGEGAQAYGWGLYFTDRKGIAEAYANMRKNAAEYAVHFENPMHAGMFLPNDRTPARKEAYDLFMAGKSSDEVADAIEKNYDSAKDLRVASFVATLRDPKTKITLPKDTYTPSGNLYKVKLHGDRSLDEFNYLRWDKAIEEAQLRKMFEGDISGDVKESLFDWLSERYDVESNDDLIETILDLELTGREIYKGIERSNDPKETSIALLKAGIDGIKYPTEFLTKRDKNDTFNYVVFDENVAEIEEHVKFQKGNPRFDAWAEGAEIKDAQDAKTGEPIIIKGYHGTTHEFYEFDSSVKGTVEGHFGRVNYFTTDEGDAAQNYQTGGADLTNRIENRGETIEQDLLDNTDESYESMYDYVAENYTDFDYSSLDEGMSAADIAQMISQSELQGGEDRILEVWLKLKNPAVIGKGRQWVDVIPKDSYEDFMDDAAVGIADENDISVEEAKEDYSWDVEQKAMELAEVENPLIEALQEALIANTYDGTIDGKDAAEILSERDFLYDSEVDLNQLETHLREGLAYAENENGDMTSSQIISDMFKNLGYDGIIMTNPSQRFSSMGLATDTSHVHIFDQYANHIKLADGTNADFGETKDIRFQKSKPTPAEKQLQGFGDKVRNVFQDSMLAVRNWQESLEREGIKIRDFENAYMKENLSHGRILDKMNRFTDGQGKRLIDKVSAFVKAGNLTMDDARNYVVAKHGPERNRWFWSQAEGNVGQDFSGLTELKERVVAETKDPAEAMLLEAMPINDFADYYAQSIEGKVGKANVDALKKAVNDATDFALKEMRDSGFLSKEQYDGLKERYDYYVPLRGWSETLDNDGEAWDYASQFGKASSPLKKAKGRKSLSDDPFAYILNMANTAVIAAERNKIAQATGNLVRNNRKAMEPYAEFKPVYFVKTDDVDEAGDPIRYETIDRPEQKLWDEGRVTMNIPTDYKKRKTQAQAKEHEVDFYENGQKMVLVMKNPEVARGLMGIKGTDWTTNWNSAVNSPLLKIGDKTVIGAPGAATRYLSQVMTSMNPAFVLPNMARDIPLAVLSEFVHGSTKDAMTMLPNLRKAEGAIRRHLFGKQRTGRVDQLYDEFLKSGAATGFIHQKDVDYYRKELERGLRDANKTMNPVTMASKGMRAGIDAVEKLSEWSENITRFAVYLNHRNKGASAEQAATEAKNSSVNFNRKGRLSPAINGLFAFFNAGVQAGDKYFKMWGANWPKMAAAHSWLAVQGFLTAMMMDLFGGDDEEGTRNYDKLSEFTRHNYMTVPVPGSEKVVTIPMPHVLRAFHGMGVSAYDMMTDRITTEEAIKNTIGSIPSDIIPVDGAGLFDRDGNLSLKPFMPTSVKPLFELGVNENFMGYRISPEPYTPKQKDMIADTKTARKNANSAAQAITDFMYELGGGDETGYRYVEKNGELKKIPDMLDLSPHTLEHLVNSYLGGTGKFVGNVYKTSEGIFKTGIRMAEGDDFKKAVEEIQLNSTPVVRRFVRTPSGDPLMGSYYDTKSEIDRWSQLIKFYENDMSIEGVNKYIDLWTKVGMPIETFKLQYDVIDKLNDSAITMQNLGDKAGMDLLEKEKRAAMREAVKSWEEK